MFVALVRQKMYAQIGFTVMDHDITFPEAISKRMIINPDVEHIDNYATFTINGEKRRCELIVLYEKSWAEASAEKGDQIVFCFFLMSGISSWQQNFYPQKFGTFELILYICGVILITTSKY